MWECCCCPTMEERESGVDEPRRQLAVPFLCIRVSREREEEEEAIRREWMEGLKGIPIGNTREDAMYRLCCNIFHRQEVEFPFAEWLNRLSRHFSLLPSDRPRWRRDRKWHPITIASVTFTLGGTDMFAMIAKNETFARKNSLFQRRGGKCNRVAVEGELTGATELFTGKKLMKDLCTQWINISSYEGSFMITCTIQFAFVVYSGLRSLLDHHHHQGPMGGPPRSFPSAYPRSFPIGHHHHQLGPSAPSAAAAAAAAAAASSLFPSPLHGIKQNIYIYLE